MRAFKSRWSALAASCCLGFSLLASTAQGHECNFNLPTGLVSFTANGAALSYAAITPQGIGSGFDIGNTTYAGWCVQFFSGTLQSQTVYQGNVYNTLSSNLPPALQNENWDLINYLLNHKQGGKDDVQQAIYFFTDGITNNLSSAAVSMIVDATANGEGFVPLPGQTGAVLFDTVGALETVQDVIIEVPCPDDTEEPPTLCDDRFTGGGFILGTPSGKKGTFGAHGGYLNGKLWGRMNYIDHDTRLHVKGTKITAYEVISENCRRATYTGTAGGQSVTIVLEVCDNGEPGRDDTLRIQVSSGYTASGDLGGPGKGGGNIQLHKPKCKNPKAAKNN